MQQQKWKKHQLFCCRAASFFHKPFFLLFFPLPISLAFPHSLLLSLPCIFFLILLPLFSVYRLLLLLLLRSAVPLFQLYSPHCYRSAFIFFLFSSSSLLPYSSSAFPFPVLYFAQSFGQALNSWILCWNSNVVWMLLFTLVRLLIPHEISVHSAEGSKPVQATWSRLVTFPDYNKFDRSNTLFLCTKQLFSISLSYRRIVMRVI